MTPMKWTHCKYMPYALIIATKNSDVIFFFLFFSFFFFLVLINWTHSRFGFVSFVITAKNLFNLTFLKSFFCQIWKSGNDLESSMWLFLLWMAEKWTAHTQALALFPDYHIPKILFSRIFVNLLLSNLINLEIS